MCVYVCVHMYVCTFIALVCVPVHVQGPEDAAIQPVLHMCFGVVVDMPGGRGAFFLAQRIYLITKPCAQGATSFLI